MSAVEQAPQRHVRTIGRFEMYGAIASGGFAAIHVGRTVGAGSFSKMVAIKRLHAQYVEDKEVFNMFLDEAMVMARVQHPNVIPTIDFIEQDGELFMVMEYVEGVSLGHLLHDLGAKKRRIPYDIILRIISGTLHGLHAAHEARDEQGRPMCIIHRDVSPDNILCGSDGHVRLLDFGVARALGRYQSTRDGQVKGKLWYMTPEQVAGGPLSRRTDIFAASVVMWQCLAGRRLFEGEHLGELALKVTQQPIKPPSTYNKALPRKCDDIVMRGLERDPAKRWETAEDMADALESAGKTATASRMSRWLKTNSKNRLQNRKECIAAMELTPAEKRAPTATQSSRGEDMYKAATTQVVGGVKPTADDEKTDLIVVSDIKARKAMAGAADAPPHAGPGQRAAVASHPATGSSPDALAGPPGHPATGSSPNALAAPPSHPAMGSSPNALAAPPSHPAMASNPNALAGPAVTPVPSSGPQLRGARSIGQVPVGGEPLSLEEPPVAPPSHSGAPVPSRPSDPRVTPVPSRPRVASDERMPLAPTSEPGAARMQPVTYDSDSLALAPRRRFGVGAIVAAVGSLAVVGIVAYLTFSGESSPPSDTMQAGQQPGPPSAPSQGDSQPAAAPPERAPAEPAAEPSSSSDTEADDPSAKGDEGDSDEPEVKPPTARARPPAARPPPPRRVPRPRPKPKKDSENSMLSRE